MDGEGTRCGIFHEIGFHTAIIGVGIEIIVWVDGYLGMLADDGCDDTGNDILCDVGFIE